MAQMGWLAAAEPLGPWWFQRTRVAIQRLSWSAAASKAGNGQPDTRPGPVSTARTRHLRGRVPQSECWHIPFDPLLIIEAQRERDGARTAPATARTDVKRGPAATGPTRGFLDGRVSSEALAALAGAGITALATIVAAAIGNATNTFNIVAGSPPTVIQTITVTPSASPPQSPGGGSPSSAVIYHKGPLHLSDNALADLDAPTSDPQWGVLARSPTW